MSSTECRSVRIWDTESCFESREKSSKANRSMWQGKPFWQCSAVYGYLQCFDTVGWASGRALACKKLSEEVLVWLSVYSKVQMISIWTSWCHCHPIISCFIKIQTGLTSPVTACPRCAGKEAIKRASVCQAVYRRFRMGGAMSVLSCLEDDSVDESCWSRYPVTETDRGRTQLNQLSYWCKVCVWLYFICSICIFVLMLAETVAQTDAAWHRQTLLIISIWCSH